MDIPDRIIDDATKLWRFRAQVALIGQPAAEIPNPVPVYADGKLAGAAALSSYGPIWYADVYLDPAIPQRLDAETQSKKWWLVPEFTPANLDGFRMIALTLESQVSEFTAREIAPVGVPLLSVLP